MRANSKDVASGLIFLAISAFFAIYSLQTLALGQPSRMGPGFFPFYLSLILAALGLIILLRSVAVGAGSIGRLPVRGAIFILLSPIVFALLIRPAGLGLTVFITSLVCAFASSRMTWKLALPLAAALSIFCVSVFVWGLGLVIPVFPPALMN